MLVRIYKLKEMCGKEKPLKFRGILSNDLHQIVCLLQVMPERHNSQQDLQDSPEMSTENTTSKRNILPRNNKKK